MTDNLTILSRITIETIQIKLLSTHAVTAYQIIAECSKRPGNNKNEHLWSSRDWVDRGARTFTFSMLLDILNKFLLLQRKHSKYMYAKCLNFLCFIKKFGCMHVCIVHVSYARLTRDGSLSIQKRWLKRPWLNKYHWKS